MRKRIYDYDYFADDKVDQPKKCARSGCEKHGSFPAPITKNNLREYHLFCMDHIREHNKNWNYFEGMNAGQLRAFEKDVECGHRPTRSMHNNMYIYSAQLNEQLCDLMYDSDYIPARPQMPSQHFSAEEKAAIELLDLAIPVTKEQLKKRYKELVKRYHPDVNQNNSTAEVQFREIVEAYQLLVHSETLA